MSIVSYRNSSPYAETSQTNSYLGVYKDRKIDKSSDDLYITNLNTKYNHRPDLLSYDLYGTPDYWWVFMRRNMDTIHDPMYDLVSGMSLYAPSIDTIAGLG